MSSTLALLREIVVVCRRLWARGLIAGQDGDVSVRLPGGKVLVTPTGMSKVAVGPDDLVELTPVRGRPRGVHQRMVGARHIRARRR